MSVTLLIAGFTLLAIAWSQLRNIPRDARQDRRTYSNQSSDMTGEPMSSAELFIQTAAHCRILQNLYVGSSGLILVAAGAFGLVGSDRGPLRPDAFYEPPDVKSRD
jgi:hypothetical protein